MSKPFTTAEIREAYLSFFAAKGCVRYGSASLVPENDPTTLFTVAGMSQFKDMFLGRGTHPFSRATTCQKCIRTNDILNVGRTARHHTFFEMLGNFSFNDYFKRETIHWAWEFLTVTLGLPPDRLSVSVHTIDDAAYDIWAKEIGIPTARIFRLGDNDNFWPANAPKEGPEGPGGCCSEIFWDHRTNDDPNDNLASSTGRFVEIWNLVFPEFNVRAPHPDGSPNLENLGRTNIDTGSGLERVAAVMQGVYNNFDIDLFQTIIRQVCAVSGRAYDPSAKLGEKSAAAEANVLIRRIADHVRAVSFCIADGALPGNTDRGYIVRRLIRRATLDIDKLGVDVARLHEIVPAVVGAMGAAYPEIAKREELARQTLKAEEELFRRTLRKGLDLFQRALDRQKGTGVFSGDDAFELVTTHGFPKEVIAELAGNEGLTFDDSRFRLRFTEHQRVSTSKMAVVFKASALQDAKPRLGATPFTGYQDTRLKTDLVLLEVAGQESNAAGVGTMVRFALAKTPFYAESGGQVGDQGLVVGDGFAIAVTDTQKDEGLVVHQGKVVKGVAMPGPVTAEVDRERRAATTAHHSATHLLHAALCRTLGDHVEQQGSKVSPDELRFDFNHPKSVEPAQLAAITGWVNEQIRAAHPADIRELPIAEAKALGAKAQFGEKYGDQVRVVRFGTSQSISTEFCGGCHVGNTRDIGSLRILKEEASSAGIRRITAVAGAAAAKLDREEAAIATACARKLGLDATHQPHAVADLSRLFKAPAKDLPERVGQLVDEVNRLAVRLNTTLVMASGELLERVEQFQTELKRLKKLGESQAAKAAHEAVAGLVAQVVAIAGVPFLAGRVDGLDGKALGQLADAVRQQRPGLILLLASELDGKVNLLAAADPALAARGLKAGDLLNAVAPAVGGRGGGRPELAQGSGRDPAGIPAALDQARAWVVKATGG